MSETSDRRGKRVDRLQVMLTDSEVELIIEWQFQNRIPSRAAAVRELIRVGLEKSGTDPSSLSGNFGE